MQTQILPGATIAILGAGQLGKMSLVAAHQLGYHSLVWAPEGDIPAMEMATYRCVAPFNDQTTFDDVCRVADVITTEWENIPLDLVRKFEQRGKLVRPGSRVLEVAQRRWLEKQTALEIEIPTTPTVFLPKGASATELNELKLDQFLPGIVKTDRLGYDGKGQWRVNTAAEVATALDQADADCVLERFVSFTQECSILVARTVDGRTNLSDVVVNTHREGILDTSCWQPRGMITGEGLMRFKHVNQAEKYAIAMAEHLKLEGILVLEFFVTADGLFFNEMAPRPHNSFHGSIEAAYTSQFEQHVRAICNLSLGRVRFHTGFLMDNLIGGSWNEWGHYLTKPQSRLHLYGKAASRPGRKMGHVTTLTSNQPSL